MKEKTGILSPNMRKYQSKNPAKRYFLMRFIARLMETVSLHNSPVSILEVGCGEGILLSEFSTRWPNASITGVDISEAAVHIAASRNPEFKIGLGDASNLAFSDNMFDIVVCAEVLEHLDNPDRALAELCRVTTGCVVLSVPHEPWFRLGNLIALSHLATLGNPPDHCNHWNRNSFEQWVSRRINVKHVETPFPWIIISGTAETKG